MGDFFYFFMNLGDGSSSAWIDNHGFLWGGLILLISSVAFAYYYYFVYTAQDNSKATMGDWWTFLLGNVLMVAIASWLILGTVLYEEPGYESYIQGELFLFSFMNGIYGGVLYGIVSLFFKERKGAYQAWYIPTSRFGIFKSHKKY